MYGQVDLQPLESRTKKPMGDGEGVLTVVSVKLIMLSFNPIMLSELVHP